MISHEIPQYPWQIVATDLFVWNGVNYVVVVDYLLGTLMTVLVQHYVLVSNWTNLSTLLLNSILHSNSHGRSVRPVYRS